MSEARQAAVVSGLLRTNYNLFLCYLNSFQRLVPLYEYMMANVTRKKHKTPSRIEGLETETTISGPR